MDIIYDGTWNALKSNGSAWSATDDMGRVHHYVSESAGDNFCYPKEVLLDSEQRREAALKAMNF